MTKTGAPIIIAVISFLAVIPPAFPADKAAGLETLQGKWSVTKTNQEGNRYTQILEFKRDQLTFRILGEDERVRVFAKGTVKVEKAGPFDALVISDIQGGRSEEDLQPVNDRRATVFALRDGNLVLAANFDRERDNEKPTLDTYMRLAAPKEAAGDAESKLLGEWKVEVNFGDNKSDYVLRLSKADGKLTATLVSPRSGDHKCKSVDYKDGELVMELDRDYQGNAVTLVYKAKLAGEGLSGTVAAKGAEDQFSGRWTASK